MPGNGAIAPARKHPQKNWRGVVNSDRKKNFIQQFNIIKFQLITRKQLPKVIVGLHDHILVRHNSAVLCKQNNHFY
jgi:hypothetical protein